jgi:hypothetical protein
MESIAIARLVSRMRLQLDFVRSRRVTVGGCCCSGIVLAGFSVQRVTREPVPRRTRARPVRAAGGAGGEPKVDLFGCARTAANRVRKTVP